MNELEIVATVSIRARWRSRPTKAEEVAVKALNARLAVFAATVARDLERQMGETMNEIPA